VAPRAAFFTSRSDHFGRPLEDGVLRALLANGWEADVFAPGGELPQTIYPPTVRRLAADYRLGWLRRQLSPWRWRRYSLFLGTPDLAVGVAGVLGALSGRPVVHVCDEIYSGGYQGQATRYWRLLAPWAMRRASFTVITDLCRVSLQRSYARLPAAHQFHAYPCCFPDAPPPVDRASLRRSLGIGIGEFVLSATGRLADDRGGHWTVRLPARLPKGTKLMIQTAGTPDPVVDALLRELERQEAALYLPTRLEWRESMRLTSAADLGLVFYLSSKPQFQAMGTSSQKLCTHLWLGQPVVATRQDSFAFLEEYRCGVLISDEAEIPEAVERVSSDYAAYSRNALRCVEEYIQPKAALDRLTGAVRELVHGRSYRAAPLH
jgi:hypothetical protein